MPSAHPDFLFKSSLYNPIMQKHLLESYTYYMAFDGNNAKMFWFKQQETQDKWTCLYPADQI